MKKKLVPIGLLFSLLLVGCGKSISENGSAIATTSQEIIEDATEYIYEEVTTEEITTEEITEAITEDPTTEEIVSNEPLDFSDLHGILVYSHDSRNDRTYNFEGTNVKKCVIFHVAIDLIDENGNATNVRSFTNEETYSCNMGDWNTSTSQSIYQKFSSDLTKLSAQKELDNGEMHVGWIDLDGNFTDVSALVTVTSDFSPLTLHEVTGFGPDNYYYFADWSEDGDDRYSPNRVMKRVPMDNLVPEAVEIVLDEYSYNSASITPAGSISFSREYYDATLSYPASHMDCYDWLQVDKAVTATTDYSQNEIVLLTFDGTDNYRNYADIFTVVDSVSGRYNKTPVISPDQTQVAFLSGLKTENGAVNSLYIVPIEGGTPIKLETSLYLGTPNDSNYSLLDWL